MHAVELSCRELRCPVESSLLIFFSLTTPTPPSWQTTTFPPQRAWKMSNSIHFGPFRVRFGPFRATSGESWGVGWGRGGGVGERGFCQGKEYRYSVAMHFPAPKCLSWLKRCTFLDERCTSLQGRCDFLSRTLQEAAGKSSVVAGGQEMNTIVGKRLMGGQNVSCDSGGGETYYRVRPPKPVLEASESGICLVCASFL